MAFDNTDWTNPFRIYFCAILRRLPVVDNLSRLQGHMFDLPIVVISRFVPSLGGFDTHRLVNKPDATFHFLNILADGFVP